MKIKIAEGYLDTFNDWFSVDFIRVTNLEFKDAEKISKYDGMNAILKLEIKEAK